MPTDFDITLSFVDQSSSASQLVVVSLNNNTLSYDYSVDRSSATIKLVVVSITIEYSKGSFKVSLGAFYPFKEAPAFTSEFIVALTSEQSNHELTDLNGLIVHHELIELIKGFVGHNELIELINGLVHICHIKLFKLSRLIVHSSSEGAQISKLIVDYILIPSSEGAQRAASKLIVESTIVFQLAGVCPARIVLCTKPHKLIGEHFSASNYADPSIICSTPHWLIVENILPGAHVIPNISCEEPHGLIVTSNTSPNFERELAFNDEASFDTSNVFSQKSKLIVDSIPSYEGAQRAASKLIVICAFGLNELIKLISASRHQ